MSKCKLIPPNRAMCCYCGENHAYEEFYDPWNSDRWFTIKGNADDCFDYPVSEEMMYQEGAEIPREYSSWQVQLRLLNCEVCQDFEADQVELSWIETITICVCPICKSMHKPVLISFPGSTKASYYRLEGRRDGCKTRSCYRRSSTRISISWKDSMLNQKTKMLTNHPLITKSHAIGNMRRPFDLHVALQAMTVWNRH